MDHVKLSVFPILHLFLLHVNNYKIILFRLCFFLREFLINNRVKKTCQLLANKYLFASELKELFNENLRLKISV